MTFNFDLDGRLLTRQLGPNVAASGTPSVALDSGTTVAISGTARVALAEPNFENTALLNIAPQAGQTTTGLSVNAPIRPFKSFSMRFQGKGDAGAAGSAIFQLWAGLTASASQEIQFSWNATVAAGDSDTAHLTSVQNAWPVVRARISFLSASAASINSAEVRLYSVF